MAALALEPRNWLKSPWEFLSRSLKVSIVWLLAAFLLSGIPQWSSCKGGGDWRQGDGRGDASETAAAAKEAVKSGNSSTQPPKDMRIFGDNFFREHPNVISIIMFLPSASNMSKAQPFSAHVYVRQGDSLWPVKIQTDNMSEFEKGLIEAFKQVATPENLSDPQIRVCPFPFPGENVIRKVRDLAAKIVPRATVVIDNGEPYEKRR